MKHKRLLLGFGSVFAMLSSLFLTAKMVATSSSDYKGMVNDILGGTGNSSGGNIASYVFNTDYNNTIEVYKRRAEIAAQLAEEGCVLLKNDNNALPLKANESAKNVTVLGSVAFTYNENGGQRDSALSFYGGIVGSKIYRQQVKLPDGVLDLPITLEMAFKEENMNVNPDCVKVYSNKNFPSIVRGSEANGSSAEKFNSNEPHVEASEFPNREKYADACFVVIGRASGEGREYMPGPNGLEKDDGAKSALSLSNEEKNLIEQASKISDKVIVLLNSAVAMEIDDLKNDDRVDSIMWIGLPGSYGMRGVARVISGTSSPSGHLSDTYAVDASASPAAQNFGIQDQKDEKKKFEWSNPGDFYNNADNKHYVNLAEDIYTGYYYYETRYADSVEGRGNATSPKGLGYGATDKQRWKYEDEIAYPFGYGMSYTKFKQEFVLNENDKLFEYDAENQKVFMNVKVTNTGDVRGKDVVQVYVQSPFTQYDIEHGVEKSAIQLATFEKTNVLEPGDSQTLTLSVDLKYIASYDKLAQHDNKVGGYVLEDADYYFAIGNGAHEALNNILINKSEEYDLFVEEGSEVIKDNARKWNPAEEELLTSSERGVFNNGINATLLNTNEDGYIIENQLEDADYNYHKEGTVTYLSRNNWEDTFPKADTGLEVTDSMRKYLGSSATNSSDVYQIKSGGTLYAEFDVDHSEEDDENGEPLKNKSIAEYKGYAYDAEEWDYLLEQITFDEAWKFSPYGGRSCKPFKSVNAPEVWQIDGPNGNITRGVGKYANKSGIMAVPNSDPYNDYLSSDMPCEPMIAATFNKELLEEEGDSFGEDSLWSKNCIAWAPGMNLHRTPFNSRNHEYYSEDPMLTNLCGTAFVRGGVKKGAILSAKHFAFNTQESFREGLTQFMEEQSARELELRAFQGLAQDVKYVNFQGNEVNALGIMTSFSRIGVCGVNAHTGLMKNILRGEWGYKGLSSTDMVVGGRYFNPQDSIINNVTFMATSNAENLLSNYWSEYNNKNKVRSDANLVNAMYENMHYYMYALANSNALNGYDADTVLADEEVTSWEKALTGLSVGSGVVAIALLGVYEYLDIFMEKRRNLKEISKEENHEN